MLDAYSIRKAVPRIVLAVIGINISIYLCVIALDLTTIAGKGLGQLLTGAFVPDGGITVDEELLDLNAVSGLAGAGILTLLVTKIVTVGLGQLILSLLPLLFIIGLIALAVFFTLVIRQGLLIFLAAISPVAIALFVLPGTEKYFKQWWDLFLKTLMVYPIIAVIFAMSNVMAAIILSDQGGGAAANILNPASIINNPQLAQGIVVDSNAVSTLKLFTAVVVIYAPLVLIPFAFKFAGGAIGAVMNAAQNATAGTRGGLQKRRGAKLDQAKAERSAKFERGGFANRGIGRVYNAAGRRKAVGAQGRYGFGERGRAALALSTGSNINETLKANPALYELRNNDDANNLLALSGGTERGMREAARDLFGDPDNDRSRAAMAAARAAGITRENAAAALQTSAQNKWRAVGAGRSDIIQEGIGRLAGGNASEAAGLAYSNQYFSREGGRGDLGGNYMDQNNQAVQDYATRHNLGLQEAQNELATIDGMGRTEVPKMLQGHTSQVGHQLDVAERLLNSSDANERILGATRLLEFQKNKTSASGDNQRLINQRLGGLGVNFEDENTSIDQQLANIASGRPSGTGAGTGTSGGAHGVNMDGNELSRLARVYDQDVPAGARGGAPTGGGGAAGPTGPPAGGPPPAGP